MDHDGDGHQGRDCGGDDCNDYEDAIVPGAEDLRGDGVDQNCDGTDGLDSDRDGHASLESGGDDCDDTVRSVHPAAEEPESTWSLESVDEGGAEPSLALDGSGRAHLCFVAADGLRHAVRAGDGWEIELVDAEATALPDQLSPTNGRRCSIAVDPIDTVHVLYAVGATQELGHARGMGHDWVLDLVDSEHDSGRYGSLALDADGHPHAVYSAEVGGFDHEIRHATPIDGEWLIEVVSRGVEMPRPTSIVVAPDGSVRAAWIGNFEADYAVRSADGSWIESRLWYASGAVALATDAMNDDYMAIGTPDVRLAVRTGDDWSYDVVAEHDLAVWYVSLAIDGRLVRHISYTYSSELHYATDSAGVGQDEIVVDAGGLRHPIGATNVVGPGTQQIAYSIYDYESEDTVVYRAIRGVADGVDQDCNGEAF